MSGVTLPTLVRRVVRRNAERCAIVDVDGRERTYAWLDARSDAFAQALRSRGVGPGDRVGVWRRKDAETVAALLGIMRLGAAYVPVDATSPSRRNLRILADCEIAAMVGDEEAALRPGGTLEVPIVVAPDDVSAPLDLPEPGDDGTAYVLYTSGSTGEPRGVCIGHRQAVGFVDWCVRTFEADETCRCSSHAPFHFDLSILDLWMPLTVGGRVVLLGEETGMDPRRLPAVIAEQGITHWYSVPSILALMASQGRLEEHTSNTLRSVCFAGEVFPIEDLKRLRRSWAEPVFWNLYGPTETNVCTAYRIPDSIPEERTDPFPIGTACDHCRVIVADADGREVEPGRVGRILCHGGTAMETYWGIEPSAVPAFQEIAGERWYDTGDLGSRDGTGSIEFHGRRDRMVKRWGCRIELGEIEAELRRHESLSDVACVATDRGETMIHAFVVPKPGATPSVIDLRAYCGGHLARSMSPDRITILDRLPRTSTGKVDVRSLVDRLDVGGSAEASRFRSDPRGVDA